jgi:hypothetical protein
MKGSTIMLLSCCVGAAFFLLLQFRGLTEVSMKTTQEATKPEAPPVLKSLDSASKSVNNVSSAASNVKLLSTASASTSSTGLGAVWNVDVAKDETPPPFNRLLIAFAVSMSLLFSCLLVIQFHMLLGGSSLPTIDQPTSSNNRLGITVVDELPPSKRKVVNMDVTSSDKEKGCEGNQDKKVEDDEKRESEKKGNTTDGFPVDKNEFPYRLSCLDDTKLVVPKGKYSVALAYHVGMVNNWKSVAADQMTTLHTCGLDKMASHTILSYSNGNLVDLLQTLKEHGTEFANPNEIVHSVQLPWEGAALNSVYGFCQRQVAQKKDKTIVFYFHNKGVSKYRSDWREHVKQNRTFTYGHSLYWRKYMEYFLLEHPERCINKIVNHGAGTCGSYWRYNNHYSGNFWTASCEHIFTLGPVAIPSSYHAAEFWIGKNRRPGDHEYHVNLHENKLRLYKELIKPEGYRNVSATRR